MNDAPRYATLQDYVRVLRKQRLVILVLTAVGAIGALAVSLAQSNEYETTAKISFRDVLSDLDVISGDDSAPEIPAFTRATINAQILTRPEVTARVKEDLGTDLSTGELADAITTRVDAQTNLVELTVRAGSADFAADLANSFADAALRIGTRKERERLREFERIVTRQLKAARKDLPQSTFQVSVLTGQLSRVQSLLEGSAPVEIAQRATEPDDPVSPTPVRNTLLGALVGLLLGLLIAFVRDALDRRVHSAHDVHDELGRPVLGRVSETAFGYHGLFQRGGPLMRPEDFEAFRVLRTNFAYLTEGGPRTVLITSANPEEGKTTVSMGLASAAAVAGQSVLLVETDLRRPSFARRFGVKAAPGLTDYLQGNAAPGDLLQVVGLADPPTAPVPVGAPPRSLVQTRESHRLVVITAGRAVSTPAELLGGERFQEFLDKVSRAYDLVVLDSSPMLAVADPMVISTTVDAVLVCVRANTTTREHVRAAREALAHLPEPSTGAIVTGLKRDGHDGYGYYYGY